MKSYFLVVSQFSFQKLTRSLNEVTVEICPKFYCDLLNNFLACFRRVLKFFLNRNYISQKSNRQ